MLELPFPLIFASFVVAGMIEKGNLWGAILALITVMIVSMTLTMLVPEIPLKEKPPTIDWTPFSRLLIMTAVFTVLILVSGWGVKQMLFILDSLSEQTAFLVGGLAGILGMGLAVFLGAMLSMQISLGEEVKQQKSFKWWVINRLTFLVAANNLGGFMVFFLQEKFPAYKGSEVAGPAARIIMFVGIFILLFAIPSGWLADRFGKKILILIAGILVGIGAAVVILAPQISGLIYVGGSIVGAGIGLFYSANWALGTELVPEDRAGQFLGLSNLAGAGAGAIGAYIGGPIADNLSYVLLMCIYGVMAILSTLALLGVQEDA